MDRSLGLTSIKCVIILVTISLFSISYVLITTHSANRYEISIYLAYPRLFWASLMLGTGSSLVGYILLLEIQKRRGIRLLFLVSFVMMWVMLLTLPIFRGYLTYGRYDVLEHLGRIKYIINSGHIGTYYPGLHLISSFLVIITNMKLTFLPMVLPMFFTVLFGIWYYLFIRQWIENKSIDYMGILVFIPFFGYLNTLFSGNVLAPFLMPLVLYMWLEHHKGKQKMVLPIIIFILFFPYLHPIHSMYLFLLLIMLDVATKNLFKMRNSQKAIKPIRLYTILLVSFMIAYGYWLLEFPTSRVLVNHMFKYLLEPGTLYNPAFQIASKYHLGYLTIVRISLFTWPSLIILSVLFITVLIIILSSKRNIVVCQNLVPFQIGVMLIFAGIFVFFEVVRIITPLRVIRMFVLVLIPSLVEFKKVLDVKIKKHVRGIPIGIILFLSVILILSTLSFFSVHESPLQGLVNQQVTQSEYLSMQWFFENNQKSISTYQAGISIYRFYDLIYGLNDNEKWKTPFVRDDKKSKIPLHYGYNQVSVVGSYFNNPVYFVIDYSSRIKYRYLLPTRKRLWPWTSVEYSRLNTDFTVDTCYASVDVQIFLINMSTDD